MTSAVSKSPDTAAAEQAGTPVPQRPPRRMSQAWRRRLPLLPALIYVIVVTQVPFAVTVIYSFQSWNLVRPGSQHWIGFDNYIALFSDTVFLGALVNTVVLTVVCVLVSLALGLGLAMLLDRKFLGRGLARTLLITPFLILPAAGALLWKTTMFDPKFGILNFVLQPFGLGDFEWLSDFPLGSVMMQIIWHWTPFMMLLILAGLQSQSKETLEAASVDGAGHWRTFTSITLPHLNRYLQLATVLGAIYIVNSFDAIYLMTQGGPGTASTNLPFYIYQRAFLGFDVGQSSAMGVVTVALTLIVATFALRLLFRTFEISSGVK